MNRFQAGHFRIHKWQPDLLKLNIGKLRDQTVSERFRGDGRAIGDKKYRAFHLS